MTDETPNSVDLVPRQVADGTGGIDVQAQRNPRRLLDNLMRRFPDPFWHMNARLLALRDEVKAALDNPDSDLDEMERIFFEISNNRHNETGPIADQMHARAIAEGVTDHQELRARMDAAKHEHLKATRR